MLRSIASMRFGNAQYSMRIQWAGNGEGPDIRVIKGQRRVPRVGAFAAIRKAFKRQQEPTDAVLLQDGHSAVWRVALMLSFSPLSLIRNEFQSLLVNTGSRIFYSERDLEQVN